MRGKRCLGAEKKKRKGRDEDVRSIERSPLRLSLLCNDWVEGALGGLESPTRNLGKERHNILRVIYESSGGRKRASQQGRRLLLERVELPSSSLMDAPKTAMQSIFHGMGWRSSNRLSHDKLGGLMCGGRQWSRHGSV